MKEKNYKPIYKWSEISPDLQRYFILRIFLVTVAALAGIAILVKTDITSLKQMYYIIVVAYLTWLAYTYIIVIYDKIYIFEGICEGKKIDAKDHHGMILRNRVKYTSYGKSYVTLVVQKQIEENEYEEIKLIVPIGHNYDIDENDTLRVYVPKNGVYTKNDNTYTIVNPILIRVAKN